MPNEPTALGDWLVLGRFYLEQNAAESGSDAIIEGLCDEVERLRSEVDRLKVEGTRRLSWLIGLSDHAASLGRKYAANWWEDKKDGW